MGFGEADNKLIIVSFSMPDKFLLCKIHQQANGKKIVISDARLPEVMVSGKFHK